MGQVDVGSQRIGWKYSTPLQAKELNTFLASISTPGLLTRPKISFTRAGNNATVTIQPFTVLIEPKDEKQTTWSEDDTHPILRVVKITTTTDIIMTATPDTIAIGMEYSFGNPGAGGQAQSQWFADIKALDATMMNDFEGLIIATCQSYYSGEGQGQIEYCITTSGADISNALLIREGWNPNCWLSLIHPKRSQFGPNLKWGVYNRFEVRKNNDAYKGYFSGNAGLTYINEPKWILTSPIDPEGTRGQMPNNFNAFKIQSAGFDIAETGETLPLTNVSGGIFAMVDASGVLGLDNTSKAFTNNLKIYPVNQEDINIYFDNNTLFIK